MTDPTVKIEPRALEVFASTRLPRSFEIKAATNTRPAEMFVYDVIGEAVTAEGVVSALAMLNNEEPLKVRINSPGGSVFEGLAIYAALRNYPGNVEVMIDGVAASAATLVAMGGDTVAMQASAMAMIHEPWGAIVGNATELRSHADILEKISGEMVSIYANKAGGDATDWANMMAAETWFNAAEAHAVGLIDAIAEPPAKKPLMAAIKDWLLPSPPPPPPSSPVSDTFTAPETQVAMASFVGDYDLAAETERRKRRLQLV